LNRAQLLKQVSDKTGMAKKEVEQVYEHTLRAIQDAVRKGEKVALTGFGRFGQRVTAARKAGMQRNPFTGEMVKVAARPARKVPRFTPAKQFKEYVSGSMKALPPMPGAAKAAGKKSSPAKKKTTAKKTAGRKTAAKKRR
jgi:DNA-binding protein HU-beta